MTTMEKTTLYIPADLHRQLEEMARRRQQPQAELIREAIRAYVQNEDHPPLRSLGIARSREITGKTARTWLRDHWPAR